MAASRAPQEGQREQGNGMAKASTEGPGPEAGARVRAMHDPGDPHMTGDPRSRRAARVWALDDSTAGRPGASLPCAIVTAP
jgi:hypothetical protein